MAKSKKEPEKLVRLSNGAVERDKGVGDILALLRMLAISSPADFESVARFVTGGGPPLSGHLVGRLNAMKFLKSADPVEFWDDVRDVIECCAQWAGNKVRFDTRDLLHKDQRNLRLSDEEAEDEVA